MKKALRDHTIAEVSRIIRERRAHLGYSMNLVSERSGLSRQMVSYVEKEERNPTLDTLLRLTEALDLDLVTVLAEAQRHARKRHTE